MTLIIVTCVMVGIGIVMFPFITFQLIQTVKALLYSCTHSGKDLHQFTQKQITKFKEKKERDSQKRFEKILSRIEGEIYHQAKKGNFTAKCTIPYIYDDLSERLESYFLERGYTESYYEYTLPGVLHLSWVKEDIKEEAEDE